MASTASATPDPGNEPDGRRDLVEAAAVFSNAFQRWMGTVATGDLSYPELRVLELLHCRGPAMLRALGDELHLTPRNMTAIADSLEADGMVARTPHPTDRRATNLELTAAGRDAAAQRLAPRLDRLGRVFDGLPPSRQETLGRTLRELAGVIDDAVGSGG